MVVGVKRKDLEGDINKKTHVHSDTSLHCIQTRCLETVPLLPLGSSPSPGVSGYVAGKADSTPLTLGEGSRAGWSEDAILPPTSSSTSSRYSATPEASHPSPSFMLQKGA